MNRESILRLVKEVKECTDIKTAIQLLESEKWIAIYANSKNGTLILGRID